MFTDVLQGLSSWLSTSYGVTLQQSTNTFSKTKLSNWSIVENRAK
jgi:hypothetical protein